MTLADIRKLFVDLTGRFDLVVDTDSYKDDGANFFIRSGSRLLDSMATHEKSYGVEEVDLKDGQAVYSIPNLLSVEGVQITVDGSGVSLEHWTESNVKANNPTASENLGIPKAYAIYSSVRHLKYITRNKDKDFTDSSFILFPAPDEDMLAYVYGRVSIPLKEDCSRNFWTIKHPETLISAAMYQIERFYRNTRGMQDHMNAVRIDIRELDNNAIESQLGSINQMRDSFEFRGEGNAR